MQFSSVHHRLSLLSGPESHYGVRDSHGAAEKAGIKAYDVIEKINGETVRNFAHLRELIGKQGGKPVQVVVARSPDRPPPVERII